MNNSGDFERSVWLLTQNFIRIPVRLNNFLLIVQSTVCGIISRFQVPGELKIHFFLPRGNLFFEIYVLYSYGKCVGAILACPVSSTTQGIDPRMNR